MTATAQAGTPRRRANTQLYARAREKHTICRRDMSRTPHVRLAIHSPSVMIPFISALCKRGWMFE